MKTELFEWSTSTARIAQWSTPTSGKAQFGKLSGRRRPVEKLSLVLVDGRRSMSLAWRFHHAPVCRFFCLFCLSLINLVRPLMSKKHSADTKFLQSCNGDLLLADMQTHLTNSSLSKKWIWWTEKHSDHIIIGHPITEKGDYRTFYLTGKVAINWVWNTSFG